jgi:hypothetical protein
VKKHKGDSEGGSLPSPRLSESPFALANYQEGGKESVDDFGSERIGQSKLHLPWKEIAANDSEVRVGLIRVGTLEVHVVEDIKEVGREFDLLALGDIHDLVQREIPVPIPRSIGVPDAAISEPESLWLRETTRVEPFADLARITLARAHVISALSAVLG